MRFLYILISLLITTSSFAFTFEGKFIQGSFILGKADPGSEVFIDKKKIKVTKGGYLDYTYLKSRFTRPKINN